MINLQAESMHPRSLSRYTPFSGVRLSREKVFFGLRIAVERLTRSWWQEFGFHAPLDVVFRVKIALGASFQCVAYAPLRNNFSRL
jgi:hypothetical protein